MLTLALPIGVAVSLLLFEITGLSAGGIISPAYVALILGDPVALALLAGTTFLTWLIVMGLGRSLFLYGSRRFSVTILVGVTLSTGAYALQSHFRLPENEWVVLGHIVPGLVAHQFARQGVFLTLVLVAIAAPLVRAAVLLIERL